MKNEDLRFWKGQTTKMKYIITKTKQKQKQKKKQKLDPRGLGPPPGSVPDCRQLDDQIFW